MALLRSDRIVSELRRRFGISAPKLSVRTHWSWKIKATIISVSALVLAGLFYGGFDAGRIFAGFNVGKVQEEQTRLTSELATVRAENEQLKRDAIELTNSSQMALGAKDVLSKQIVTLQQENTQLKEEAAFFEKLMGNANGAKNGLAVQRLQAERDTANTYRFRALVVQGSAEASFKGRLSITAIVAMDQDNRRITINLPEDQPDLLPSMALDFKAYQRVQGVFKIPPNAQLKTLNMRVLPAGSATPKAQQSIQL
jgi:transposase-like protein